MTISRCLRSACHWSSASAYYAWHRMGDDTHVRFYADGTEKELESIIPMCSCSANPVEDPRLHAEYAANNQRILRDLQAKGFVLEGDEPGHVGMNWYLQTGAKVHPLDHGDQGS